MTADTDTLVARLRELYRGNEPMLKVHEEAADCIEALEGQRDAAFDIVQGIEILTATGHGLTPEETAALHWMAQAGRSDTPITEPTLFSELVKAQEAIVRLIAERDAWKANAEALAREATAAKEADCFCPECSNLTFRLATHEALMKGGA